MNLNSPIAIPSLTIAGRVFTDLANLKVLAAAVDGTNVFSNFRIKGQVSGASYTPSGAKKFDVWAGIIVVSGAASTTLSLGYGDNDVGYKVATTPTNPIYQFGTNGHDAHQYAGINGRAEYAFDYQFPNGKYPFVFNFGSSVVGLLLYGYEV